MIHTMAVPRPKHPIQPPAAQAGGSSDAPTLTEEVIALLYDKKILDAAQVSKASVKLRLRPQALAQALGYDDVSDFYSEFVTNRSDTKQETSEVGWKTWTYDEMATLVRLHFREKKPAALVAQIMQKRNPARTYKSVKSFLRRTFEQGNMVDQYVWELLLEGNSAEDIADAGYNSWRVEFADQLMRLRALCATIDGAPEPVISFRA